MAIKITLDCDMTDCPHHNGDFMAGKCTITGALQINTKGMCSQAVIVHGSRKISETKEAVEQPPTQAKVSPTAKVAVMYSWENKEAAIWYHERLRDLELSHDYLDLSVQEWIDQTWSECARQNKGSAEQQTDNIDYTAALEKELSTVLLKEWNCVMKEQVYKLATRLNSVVVEGRYKAIKILFIL